MDYPSKSQFLDFEYPEAKDLCKHFLTIISGVLVFSVTFSEKIIDFHNATTLSKVLLGGAWVSLVVAVVLVGVGLWLFYSVGVFVTRGLDLDRFIVRIQAGYVVMNLSGVAFVAGLALLVATGVIANRYIPWASTRLNHTDGSPARWRDTMKILTLEFSVCRHQ